MRKQERFEDVELVARPERAIWCADLVAEMTGMVPIVKRTTMPVLIDGMWWQVAQVVATVPAFVSAAGVEHPAMSSCGNTEEEALRALCEGVHAAVWLEQEMVALGSQELLVAGSI